MAFANTRDPNSGRGTPAGWSSAEAYGKAYGEQRKKAGRDSTLGVTNAEYKAAQRKGGGGGGGINLGNLLQGFGSMFAGKKAQEIAEAKRKWMEEQNTIAYERSLPWSSYGPAGNVEFDPETKEIMKTLDPEFQSLMSGWLGVSGKAKEELLSVMGDPNKLAKTQFDMLQEFSADDYARSRMQGEETSYARGMLGTESYYSKKAIEDSINKSILADKLSSVGLGMDYRQMLMAESLGFGKGGMDVAGMLDKDAAQGILVGQGSHTGMNMQGIRESGHDYADTQSALYSGMLDQGAKYNTEGKMTQGAQQGFLSQIMGGLGLGDSQQSKDKEYYSALTDDTRWIDRQLV